MKKLLIVNNNMHIGGIQKSLVNLLEEISEDYEIDLFLFANIGELKDSIPKSVHITEGGFFTQSMGLTHEESKKKDLPTFLNRSFWTVMTRIFKTKFSFGILSRLESIKGEYDCAISNHINTNLKTIITGRQKSSLPNL